MRVVAIALLLAGCAAPEPEPPMPLPPALVAEAVPAELRSCPVQPAAIPAPHAPRTFDTVVAWAAMNEITRAQTAHALEVCRSRLQRLNALNGAAK
jgi:PBP1b-binding outer membrane lipoprotein LpoB